MNLFKLLYKRDSLRANLLKYRFYKILLFSFVFLVVINGCKKTVDLAVLKTTPVVKISTTSVSSGGYIINDNGSEITERGVCWSTSQNPTIDNNRTIDGAGKGIYTSNINNLLIGYTYFVRAYATNEAGISYGNQISFSTSISGFAIGNSYQGGIIAYIEQSSDTNQIHGFITAPGDQSSNIKWYNGTYTVTGASSIVIGSGNTNTNIIIANQGAGNYAAQICADLNLGGYNDWYLPSKDELNQLYLNRIEIGGFADGTYWSSSEQNVSTVWSQDFATGDQSFSTSKYSDGYVRAIRSF